MVDKVKIEFDIDDNNAVQAINNLDKNFERFSKDTTSRLTTTSRAFDSFVGNLAANGASKAIAFITDEFGKAFDASKKFESGLLEVAKTSNLSEAELSDLAGEIDKLAARIPVTTEELLKTSKVAGQLGVEGSKDILAFAETISKLGKVSDLEGEQAASTLARILNITGEANGTIGTLASVVVSLGNNFAATESEIAAVTNEVARATAQFGVTSAEAAALSTTLRAVGVRAEEAGGVIGKAFLAIESAVKSGGKDLKQLEKIVGSSGEEIQKQFGEEPIKLFENFILGLRRMKGEGAILERELAALGIEGIRVQKVLPVLADNSENFARALALANAEVKNATALDNEFSRALGSAENQTILFDNAVENLRRRIGDKLTGAFKIASPFLTEFITQLSESKESTFIRQAEDVKVLEKELGILRKQLAAVNADGKISFFEADPEEITKNIGEIQKKISELSTQQARDELNVLQDQLKSLESQKAIPLFEGILPEEGALEEQTQLVKDKIANLQNFIALSNDQLNTSNEDARARDLENALTHEDNKFNALVAIKEAQKERDVQDAEAEVLANQASKDLDFQQLEQHLGRKEAANILFRAKELTEEGKQAKAKELIANSVEKAEQANRKRKLQFEAQNNTALVGLAAASANAILQIAGASAKATFLISKAIGIAQVLINSNIAASLAVATIPPPAGEAVAAQRLVQGKIQAATIAATAVGEFAQRFQDGGFIQGTTSGDKVGVRANGGEAILNPQQQKNFMDIANGKSNNSDTAAAINNLANAIMSRPNVVSIDGREVFRSVQGSLDSGSSFTKLGAA